MHRSLLPLFRVSTVAVCVLAASLGMAAEIQVSPGPSALADAISKSSSGDTLILKPGMYRERVVIDKTLTLRGTAGAVLEGADERPLEWTAAGNDLKNVFTAPLPKRPYGLLVDGKFIAELRYDRAQSKGDWNWRTLLAKGPPLSGFKEIRALWIYDPKEQRVYARFDQDISPEKLKISWLRSTDPLLTISKATGVVIEDLAFAHGACGIEITDGATKVVVRRCSVTSYEKTGIALSGGASHCTVENCTIARGAYEEWQPTLAHSRENYEIWKIHKEVGNYDRVGIDLFRAGGGNRILNNHLDRVFDGICLGDSQTESIDKPLADPDHGRDTEIAGNIIENTRDSGIELGVGCINVNVHHNTLRRTHGGFRFKVPRIGPVFIHHNQLIDGSPFNFWFSMDAAPAEGYVYHNTITGGGRTALEYSSFKTRRSFATPKWHFLNNFAPGRKSFFEGNRGTPPADFTDSHNVIDGTAMEAGVDLSTYRQGKPLPGCEPGYFKGKAPDAGAGAP